MNITINVDMDKKCAECRKGGAVENGLCLGCTAKAIGMKPMKSQIGKAVQARMRSQFDRLRDQA